MEVRIIGRMDNTLDNTFESANRVYDSNGLSPNLLTCSGGNIQPKVLEVEVLGDIGEKKYDCVAMRGRGDSNEQTLEINSNGLVNSITTVQKDNFVLIRQNTKDGLIPCKIGGVVDLSYPESKTRRGRVIENGEICPTLTTENIPNVLEDWVWEIEGQQYLIRIRKLTPLECWRLMGFSDEDFKKAEVVNSNTQLYKQAGNSIVVNVLEEVFKQMIS